MAKLAANLLLLFSISYIILAEAAAKPIAPKQQNLAANFIKSSCRSTTYPAVCVRSLSVYANAIQTSPRQLAQTALAVSLGRAQSSKQIISRMSRFKGLKKREYQAIRDCIEEMNDTVDRLTRSVQELKLCGQAKGDDLLFHVSNAQTWTSAALTDENTCLDGFAGRALNGKMKNLIRTRILYVTQETSNALALINSLASKH